MSVSKEETPTVATLEDIREWGATAQIGDTARFFVSGEISREQSSELAWQISNARLGHIWITRESTGYVPEPVTILSVRCSA